MLDLSSRNSKTVGDREALDEAKQGSRGEVAAESPVSPLCGFRSAPGKVGKVSGFVLKFGASEATQGGNTGGGESGGDDLVNRVGGDTHLTGGEVHRTNGVNGSGDRLHLTGFDLVGGGEGVGGSGDHGHLVGGGGEKTHSREDGEDAEDGECEHHTAPLSRQRVGVKGEREKRSAPQFTHDVACGAAIVYHLLSQTIGFAGGQVGEDVEDQCIESGGSSVVAGGEGRGHPVPLVSIEYVRSEKRKGGIVNSIGQAHLFSFVALRV